MVGRHVGRPAPGEFTSRISEGKRRWGLSRHEKKVGCCSALSLRKACLHAAGKFYWENRVRSLRVLLIVTFRPIITPWQASPPCAHAGTDQ